MTEATPDQEIDELWSPPPVVEDDDPDYVPSEVGELKERRERFLLLYGKSCLARSSLRWLSVSWRRIYWL